MSQRPPLAVVGYAYRAPGVGRTGLFQFLEQGKSAWSEVPEDRFNHAAYYHPEHSKPGFISSKGGHFIPDDLYAFDPAFFNIKADEARCMDPQHRLLLECAYEAAESAGLTLKTLMGANIGVFAAGDKSEYYNTVAQDLSTSSIFTATGINPCMFSNRLSYFFGLTGPSVTVDAACASSSYAIHLACQSILAGECSAAFVGGAKTLNGPNQWIELDTMGTLSAEGRCFSYDARASGFGRGEGAACIIIKPMSDALVCGDPVRAIILNSAANHSGRTQGISMPGRQSQKALLARLHNEVGVDPHFTTYVEGHGTGTPVGDPIEAESIVSVLAGRRSTSNPLYIGSVKSNLGHTENASGLLSLIKCIMMLENEMLLPNTNFTEFNPKIEGSERLKVPVESMTWPTGSEKRICMSNFGFGGSNAALLLEAAPGATTRNGHTNGHSNGHSNSHARNDLIVTDASLGDNPSERLVVFSAKSHASLSTYVSSFLTWLQREPASAKFLDNLSYTLGQRRNQFSHRHAVSADSIESLKQILESVPVGINSGVRKVPVLAFIFTGQGAQYAQMASRLHMFDVFREVMKDAEKTLLKLGATWQLLDELRKPANAENGHGNMQQSLSRIDDAEISQPACTALQLALIALLRSWGVTPAVVLGHSSGEIAAAYAAGFISFEAALAISYFRGLAANRVLAHDGVKGAMLAVGASPEDAEKLFPSANSHDAQIGYATIAAVNSPQSVTISGDISAIDYIHERAEEQGLFVRRLKVGVAYHSKHMELASASYMESIQPFCSEVATKAMLPYGTSLEAHTPAFISSVTGKVETSAPSQAVYWVHNLLQPVQYSQAVQCLFDQTINESGKSHVPRPDIVIEVGSHAALQNPTKHILDGVEGASVQYLPSLVRDKDASRCLVELAGKLFCKGSEIDLEAINQARGSEQMVLHDLPSYEWNKTSQYVYRPRVGTSKLFGGQAYHKLLGWHSPYTEGSEHSFRNVFTLDDQPWIRDHVVAGNALFPFTGFISLAVEAFRIIVGCADGSDKTLDGILVREFHVTSSLKVEEDQGVDVTTKLRPAGAGPRTSSTTVWSFEILSWTEAGGWEQHAYGLIEGQTNSENAISKSSAVQAALRALSDGSLRQLNVDHEYELLQETYKVVYGPSFRTAVDFWSGPDVVVHNMVLRSIEPNTFMPESQQHSPVTVDPPTLDTILHSFGVIRKEKGQRSVIVPTYCCEWRISNQIAAKAGQKLSIVSRCLSHDQKSGSMEMDFVVFELSSSAGDGLKAVAEIGPLKFQCITRPDPSELSLPDTFFTTNIPYLDLMSSDELSRAIQRDMPTEIEVLDSEISHRRDLDQAALHFISQALQEDYGGMSSAPDHLVGFSDWAQGVMARYPVDESLDKDALLSRVASSNATGELVSSVGNQLPSILRGEKQPLEVMLENGLLWRTYAENVAGIRANVALAGYLQRLLAVHPDLNILELGAGTASATLPVLEAIDKGVDGAEPAFTYTFTDISSGFFDKAREKLQPWSRRMVYKKLDISHDPSVQGFTMQSYDVVLASNVLHATPDIIATLHNVESLMRPGGKLLLMEGVVSPPPSFIPYALLPGWWLFEDDYRIDGPLLTKDSWDMALKTAGFSGLEGSIDDYPGRPEQLFSALWSTKLVSTKSAQPQDNGDQTEPIAPTLYYCSHHDADSFQFAKEVSAKLESSMGKPPTTLAITEAGMDGPCESIPIILDGKRQSIFGNTMTSEVYQKLKAIMINNPSLLWVLPKGAHPDSSMIKGLLRTLRLELPSSRLVLLETSLDSRGAAAVEQILKQLMQKPFSRLDTEQEFLLRDNVLHVPRVRLAAEKREVFAVEAGLTVKAKQSLGQHMARTEQSLEVTVEAAGSPDSVYFQYGDALKNVNNLAPDQIIVEVEAAGLNFIDLLTVLGSLSWNPLGLEGVGSVIRVGSGVSDLSVGDKVIYAVDKAGMATHVRMPRECAHRLPSAMLAVDAASMPIAFSTAILSLLDVGRLAKDDSVLIHCASGATGQACLQVAQSVGCVNIFVTAGTPEKRAFLADTYGIPDDHIFSSRNSDFKPEIMAATSDRGVDVIVNCLSGTLLRQTWDLIAEGGRFLEIGKKDLLDNSHLPMRQFVRNVSFSGIDLRRTIATQPKTVQRYLSTIVRMLADGAITPVRSLTQLPASRLTEGLRKLQSGKNIGKVIITFHRDDEVLAESPSTLKVAATSAANRHQATRLLRHDATYVIAGGTGGIGRALVPWMVDMGAKFVVMLGRSALSNPKVKAILEQFEGKDVVVRAIPCDVGSIGDVESAVAAMRDLPMVCGVVHSAIALRDSFLANLTYEDWQATAKSRIQGAWNLDYFFPSLDFFVCLSGMTGITGNAGQSVYTATSTFMEAFVDDRHKRGLPATVIHLPPVSGIGLVAETNLIQRLRSTIGATLRGTEVLTLIEAAILGESAELATEGRHLSWSLVPATEVETLPWEHFNPLSVMGRRRRATATSGDSSSSSPNGVNGREHGNNQYSGKQDLKSATPEVLMSALIEKVSAMTAIERSEITPDRSLQDYGLDSLISLELRNWIRRNFEIRMDVKDINSSADLNVVADRIMERTKKE